MDNWSCFTTAVRYSWACVMSVPGFIYKVALAHFETSACHGNNLRKSQTEICQRQTKWWQRRIT
jgi:hypothetical protein